MKNYFMNRQIIRGLSFAVVLVALEVACTMSSGRSNTVANQGDDSTVSALDAYIHNDDRSFGWEIETYSVDEKGADYVVDMTSQTWHGIVWKHKMYIIEPGVLTNPEHCVLFITGGANGDGPREAEMQSARLIANLSGMYAAVLWQVPNQPLYDGKYEDDLITETLLKMLETKDSSWPLLLPMAKSAIRAMDTVQELLKQHRSKNIKGFVVFGASKRGWTTWLTAATNDNRILAIAPMVINTLNMQPQYVYQMANWGYYSEQIGDYYRKNLLAEQVDPDASAEEKALRDELWHIIDPYFYRERVTIPKLLIHGTNDRYWNLDATRFYWNDLVGPKYLLNLPNVGHNLGGEQRKALTTIAAYSKLVSDGETLPAVNWKEEFKDGRYALSVTSDITATGAKLWVAYCEGRDFREAKWNATELQPLSGSRGNYFVMLTKPEKGHIAFYVEIETVYKGIPCSVTTEVVNP